MCDYSDSERISAEAMPQHFTPLLLVLICWAAIVAVWTEEAGHWTGEITEVLLADQRHSQGWGGLNLQLCFRRI